MASWLAAFVSLAAVTHASAPPSYSGYNLIWSDDFAGNGGSFPNTANWNIISGYLGVNDELETYQDSTTEVQLSGGETLQLVPWTDSTTEYGWSSGRIESIYTLTPSDGEVTRVEASLQFGTNPTSTKQGLWPAFWMLGDALRTGAAEWPACGELDIMEQVDGVLTGYGTMHCDVDPGGICNEPSGLGASTGIPDQSWHTWRLEWDRTNSNWEDQTITWSLDGTTFHQILGSQIGDSGVWAAVAQSPVYFILNMAVGGDWVSDPRLYDSCCY